MGGDQIVSVPWPGFYLLKAKNMTAPRGNTNGFQSRGRDSICWKHCFLATCALALISGFSPVAGILFVERVCEILRSGHCCIVFQSRCRDSICWKPLGHWLSCFSDVLFQSRCRDSICWKRLAGAPYQNAIATVFQSRCRDSICWKWKRNSRWAKLQWRFSPVAGILFVERPIAQTQSERGFCQRFSSASFSPSLQPRLLQPVRNCGDIPN